MAKPVDKVRRIRYDFYGILIYLTYLYTMDGGLFGVLFLFLGYKNGAAAPVDYSSAFATAPQYELMYVSYPFYPQVIYSNPLEYALFPNDRLRKVQALKFFLFLINCILL